jgi:hypothetical protein
MVLRPKTLSGAPFCLSSMMNQATKIRGCIRIGNAAEALRFEPS